MRGADMAGLLPPLMFGVSDARTVRGNDEASAALGSVIPGLRACALAADDALVTRSAVRTAGRLRFLASASSPGRLELEDTAGWTVVIPCAGRAVLRCAGHEYAFRGGSNILFLPNFRRSTTTSARSTVFVSLSIERLEATRRAMCGDPDARARVCSRVHFLPIDRRPELFSAFIRLCQLLDASQGPELAASLNLEDVFYRWLVASLGDPLDPGHDVPKRLTGAGRFDRLCEMIAASGDRPFTLTEMEGVAGMSSRSLQYAFKARLGCSPMEWQRRQRLAQARRRLQSGGEAVRVTDVALSAGFSSSAAFSACYRREFGETPSQTLGAVGRALR